MFSLLYSNPGSSEVSVGPRYFVEGRDEEKQKGLNHHFSS